MTAFDVAQVELCPWALREGIMVRHSESQRYPAEYTPQSIDPPRSGADEAIIHELPARGTPSPARESIT